MRSNSALSYLEPREAGTRGAAVLDALAGMIERAGLQVGDRLPPEVQLAQQLGVGRSTMREALNRWEGLGIIRRRRGDGTYLSARVQTSAGAVPVMVQLEGAALLRLLEVRRSLESDVVRKAALHATPSQRSEIGKLCDDLLEIIARGENYREADAAFHAAISEATGNPMYGQILRRLDEMMERSAESPFTRPAFGLASFPMHRDLADGIIAGDADRAGAAIAAIIDSVETEIRGMIGLSGQP
jgi:GntR family transcriptional regulator, transcriptional repressor for pyruvate dehydrogenase complex